VAAGKEKRGKRERSVSLFRNHRHSQCGSWQERERETEEMGEGQLDSNVMVSCWTAGGIGGT